MMFDKTVKSHFRSSKALPVQCGRHPFEMQAMTQQPRAIDVKEKGRQQGYTHTHRLLIVHRVSTRETLDLMNIQFTFRKFAKTTEGRKDANLQGAGCAKISSSANVFSLESHERILLSAGSSRLCRLQSRRPSDLYLLQFDV